MASLNALRVRDLIRAVRKCQSPGEEQELINKERSRILKEAKEDDSTYNLIVNILKLIYIAMIGYSTSTGLLEVMKLLTHKSLSGKRTAYLALCNIAEDKEEILTLVENHIRTDALSTDLLQRAAALNAVANVGNEDMCRDLLDTILQLVPSANPFIRKKACLCGLRIVQRIPEFSKYFLEKLTTCFFREYSGSIMCALALVNYSLQTPEGEGFIPLYRERLLQATTLLKALFERTTFPDCSVGGILDPFLQVKILEFLRIIARRDPESSLLIRDLLAAGLQISGRERNVCYSIHYECARTIVAVESDKKLRSAGIKAMSELLGTRFDNFRYIALGCLSSFAFRDLQELQSLQHSRLILDCLKSPDPSIEMKGIDLLVKLINENNIKNLLPDLLDFLNVTSGELKRCTARHLCTLLMEKSPTEEWAIETSLRLLRIGKQEITMEFVHQFLALISRQPVEVQGKATASLWSALPSFPDVTNAKGDGLGYREGGTPQETLAFVRDHVSQLLCTIWCAGEYSAWLVRETPVQVEEMVHTIQGLIRASESLMVKRYGLTALMKIGTRHPAMTSLVQEALSPFRKSVEGSLRQWAIEYHTLLTDMTDTARVCFAPMPPMEKKETVKEEKPSPVEKEEGPLRIHTLPRSTPPVTPLRTTSRESTTPLGFVKNRRNTAKSTEMILDDLLGPATPHGPSSTSSFSVPNSPALSPVMVPPTKHEDPLAYLFGDVVRRTDTVGRTVPPALAASWLQQHPPYEFPMERKDSSEPRDRPGEPGVEEVVGKSVAASDWFNATYPLHASPALVSSSAASPSPPDNFIPCKELADFTVSISARMADTKRIRAYVRITSTLRVPMEQIEFHASVPQYAEVNLDVMPCTQLQAFQSLTQGMEVSMDDTATNPNNLLLRVKLLYSVDQTPREQSFEVNEVVI